MSERSTKLGDKTEKLLEYWASRGLISAENQQAIREHHAKAAKPSSSVRLPLFLLGAVFLGLGLIFAVGAGWFQVLPPHALPFICLALLALALAIAIALELWPKIDTQKGAARLVSGLAVILCFFLIPAYLVSVARAYQQQSDLPGFYLTWFYAAAPLLILQRRGLLLGLLNILPIPYFILSPSAQQPNLMLFVVLSLLNASYLLLRYQPALASAPARKLLNIASGWPKWAATIKLDSVFWVNIISLLWAINCYFLLNEYSRYYLESHYTSGTTVDLLFILLLSASILFGRGMKMGMTSRFRRDHIILHFIAELSLILQIAFYSGTWYLGEADQPILNYTEEPLPFLFALLCLAMLLVLSTACHISHRRRFQLLPKNEFAPYLYWSAGYLVLQLMQSFGWLTLSTYLIAPAWGILALLLLFALRIKQGNSPSILHLLLFLALIIQHILTFLSYQTSLDLLYILLLSSSTLFILGMTSNSRSQHKTLRFIAEFLLILQIFVYSNAWYIGEAKSFFLPHTKFPFTFFFGLLCLAILLLLSAACHVPSNINGRRSFQLLPKNKFAPYLYWCAGYFGLQLLQSSGWLAWSVFLIAYPAWGLLPLLLLFALHIKRGNSPSILHQFLVLTFILQYVFMSISDFSLRAIATLVIGAVFLLSSLLTLRKRKSEQEKGA